MKNASAMSPALLIPACCLLLSVPGFAAQPATQAPPPAPAPSQNQTSETKLTLVKKNADGSMARLDDATEPSALRLLTLSAEEQSKTQEILSKRRGELLSAMRNAPDLVGRIVCANEDGMEGDRRLAVRDLSKIYPGVRDRGKLLDELRGALSEANAAKLDALVRDYGRSATNAAADEQKAKGYKGNVFVMATYESLRVGALEVQTALLDEASKSVKTPGEIVGAIQPGTFGLEKVQARAKAMQEREKDPPVTPEEMREFVRFALVTMPPSQRTAIAALILGGAGGGPE